MIKMERVIIQVPSAIKRRLDALRTKGYTASGFVRALLERELKHVPEGRKGGR